MMRSLLRIIAALTLCMASLGSIGANANSELVLVAGQGVKSGQLSRGDLRKLFLGLPTESAGTLLVPMVNRSDPALYQVFLQKVMFMSQRIYERQVISLAFRSGSARPEVVEDPDALPEKLSATAGAVTVMWSDDARALEGVVILQVLAYGAQQ